MNREPVQGEPSPPESLPQSSWPGWHAAQRARAPLSDAFVQLQRLSAALPELEAAVVAFAAASSALYEVEKYGTTTEAMFGRVQLAMAQLGTALSALQSHADPRVEPIARRCAETLGVLYPVARSHQRQRHAVIAPGQLDATPTSTPLPPIPEAPRHRRPTPYYGRERRTTGGRVHLQVDIGMWSASHFYAGLSLDVSQGGLFVATYRVLEPGTKVCLYFQLPSGEAIETEGRVTWLRDASEDTPPGMGISFFDLDPSALAAIERFCAQRAPLYHQSADG